MKTLFKSLTVMAVVAGMALSVHAVPITGGITMTGSLTFDTNTVNTATTVTSWGAANPVTSVVGMNGFVNVGDLINYPGPWTFIPTTPTLGLWNVDGFIYDLTSATVNQGGGFLNIVGTGTLHYYLASAGLDPTPFEWRFSSQDPPTLINAKPTFSWSASAFKIPDGGTTALLLGMCLLGVGFVARRFKSV